jgi:hypothetical protein
VLHAVFAVHHCPLKKFLRAAFVSVSVCHGVLVMNWGFKSNSKLTRQ